MAAHGLEEFEYEHGGLHIRLRKAFGAATRLRQAPAHVRSRALQPDSRAPVGCRQRPPALP